MLRQLLFVEDTRCRRYTIIIDRQLLVRVSDRKELALKWVTFIVPSHYEMSDWCRDAEAIIITRFYRNELMPVRLLFVEDTRCRR